MPKGVSKWTKRIPVLGAALSMADGFSGVSSWSSIAGNAAGDGQVQVLELQLDRL